MSFLKGKGRLDVGAGLASSSVARDAVGAEMANPALSDQRAEAVATALTNVFDIAPENMETQRVEKRSQEPNMKVCGPGSKKPQNLCRIGQDPFVLGQDRHSNHKDK
ncbi:OmpA family protein [Mesorhizobium wenxiniae]|uniref:Uncharacterized protein n=1 Tax=Mesorhizobium wenxiniae TaxID=2014805 RepID=A0A271KCS6_9HYPH|nr:OmpA family protein [Mesorhizobium wenxiniae]PAP93284.1 hypothetical protein CIT31_22720 [Mesorhizobium wenxiniae]